MNKINYLYIAIIFFLFFNIERAEAQRNFKATEYTVNDIHFIGNKSFTPENLKKQLTVKEKQLTRTTIFTRRLIELNRIHLKTFYVSNGYLNCTVKDSFFVFGDGNVDLYFTIHEGKQFILEDIQIQGNKIIEKEYIIDLIDHKLNTPYNPVKIRNTIKQLQDEYANKGKPLAKISDSLEVNKKSIRVYLQIYENVTMHIGKIIINCPENIDLNCISREILLKPGDLYSREKITKSKKHIYATGLFSGVNINSTNLNPANQTLDLEVSVRELKMRTLGFDVGFGQNRGVSSGSEPYTAVNFKGKWIHRNLFSRGTRLNLNFGSSLNISNIFMRPNANIELMYIEPWLLGFRSSNLFKIFFENQLQDNNEKLSFGSEAALIIQPDKRFSLRTGVEIKGIHYRYEQLETKTSELDKERERAIFFTMRRDVRDNFLFPKMGSVLTINSKIVGSILGGTQDYFKLEGSFSNYLNIYKEIVLALRTKVGIINTFDSANETPGYEKFYLGGETSMRGWANRRFISQGNLPVGDDIKILTNLEIRFPLFWILGGEIFIDSGNLIPDISTLISTPYRWNFGFGITIATPLGPVRVDYARIINPLTQYEIDNPWQIQFAIPYAF